MEERMDVKYLIWERAKMVHPKQILAWRGRGVVNKYISGLRGYTVTGM
jgi:hypothetical protein